MSKIFGSCFVLLVLFSESNATVKKEEFEIAMVEKEGFGIENETAYRAGLFSLSFPTFLLLFFYFLFSPSLRSFVMPWN